MSRLTACQSSRYLRPRAAAAILAASWLISAAAAEPIRICHIDDRSGPAADIGTESYNGLQIAVSEAIAAGGIGGRRVEIVAYDGKTDPQLSATYAVRCADKGSRLVKANLANFRPAAP